MDDAADAAPAEEVRVDVADDEVSVLRGHVSEVFICAWNPKQSSLASGSGDSTARVWKVPSGASGFPAGHAASDKPAVLKHGTPLTASERAAGDKSRDVTTLSWNSAGTLLATGSYDGLGRVWSAGGELRSMLSGHRGPIFSLKWNPQGDFLLSSSVDKSAIVWDAASGELVSRFELHSAPVLDADWRDNTCFATCSTDKSIMVCKVGEPKPLKVWKGHRDEVNAIRWDSRGNLLASCSDDATARLWSTKTSSGCVHELREHEKAIYTLKWAPGDACQRLATASFDATVKMWDVETGKALYTLVRHTDPVYSIDFSPNGEYIASGSFDRCLNIWSVRDGSLVKSYRGAGGIFEVAWSATGDKVAASMSNNTVCIVDFRS